MEWAFRKDFAYPFPPCGIQDLAISSADRCGLRCAASSFYSNGMAEIVDKLEKYCKTVGDMTFSMADPDKYPAALAHCHWPLEMTLRRIPIRPRRRRDRAGKAGRTDT